MATILLVDDSHECKELVSAAMKDEHRIEWVETLQQAVEYIQSGKEIDMVLLDINMPDGDGIEFLSKFGTQFRSKDIPTIFLSGTSTVQSRIRGFALGALDFISKPFDVDELKVRIDNKLQVIERVAFKSVWNRGSLQIDIVRQQVFDTSLVPKRALELTPVEFRILLLFAQNNGEVVARKQILQAVWGDDPAISARVVDHHICGLRKKVAVTGQRISSVYGIGYRLEPAGD